MPKIDGAFLTIDGQAAILIDLDLVGFSVNRGEVLHILRVFPVFWRSAQIRAGASACCSASVSASRYGVERAFICPIRFGVLAAPQQRQCPDRGLRAGQAQFGASFVQQSDIGSSARSLSSQRASAAYVWA